MFERRTEWGLVSCASRSRIVEAPAPFTVTPFIAIEPEDDMRRIEVSALMLTAPIPIGGARVSKSMLFRYTEEETEWKHSIKQLVVCSAVVELSKTGDLKLADENVRFSIVIEDCMTMAALEAVGGAVPEKFVSDWINKVIGSDALG